MEPTQITVHSPAAQDHLAVIDAGLDEHNVSSAPLKDVQPLHVIATGDDGAVTGGAIGRTWGKCCELQQLWVASQCRHRRMGSQLMDSFEREALRRGCDIVYLDSFSFQAPEFYVQRGYVEVLRIVGFTGGVTKSTLHKRLHGGGANRGQQC